MSPALPPVDTTLVEHIDTFNSGTVLGLIIFGIVMALIGVGLSAAAEHTGTLRGSRRIAHGALIGGAVGALALALASVAAITVMGGINSDAGG